MRSLKKIFIFSILTLFFSVIIFFVKFFFLDIEQTEIDFIEDNFIEPAWLDAPKEKKPIKKIVHKKEKVKYTYLPNSFKRDVKVINHRFSLDRFFLSDFIESQINFLNIYLYKDKKDVRGRMKSKKIHLFWASLMPKKEILSVAIHEFWHFFDLYILQKGLYEDISDFFYDISWESTTVIKSSQKQMDFVSGYAMTNKYEDFAESFTYYILHNRDFLEKAQKSKVLQKKYDFFGEYVFINSEFQENFSKNNHKIKPYYRDITKIDYDLALFLDYLK